MLGLKNFKESIREFDEDERSGVSFPDPHGREQLTTFLTRDGVYRLVMRSNKAIARPFQKWIAHVLGAIEDTGRYDAKEDVARITAAKDAELEAARSRLADLQAASAVERAAAETRAQLLAEEKAALEAETAAAKSLAADRLSGEEERISRAYVDANAGRSVTYIAKIKTIDGNTLVKIGSTASLIQSYGACRFISVHVCERHLEFERFLQRHHDIKSFKYDGVVHGDKRSSEMFLVPADRVERVRNIAARNVGRFIVGETTKALRKVEENQRAIMRALDIESVASEPDNESADRTPREARPRADGDGRGAEQERPLHTDREEGAALQRRREDAPAHVRSDDRRAS